jgi:hypothetical protein
MLDVSFDAQLGSPATQNSFCHYGNREGLVVTPVSATRRFPPTRRHPRRAGTGRAPFRVMHLLPGIGPASAQRILDHMAEATDPLDALSTLPSPPRIARFHFGRIVVDSVAVNEVVESVGS